MPADRGTAGIMGLGGATHPRAGKEPRFLGGKSLKPSSDGLGCNVTDGALELKANG